MALLLELPEGLNCNILRGAPKTKEGSTQSEMHLPLSNSCVAITHVVRCVSNSGEAYVWRTLPTLPFDSTVPLRRSTIISSTI